MIFNGPDFGEPSCSCKDFANDVSRHVGQTEISASIAVRQSLVVQAQEREQIGMKVGRIHSSFDGVNPILVASSI